VSLVAVVGASVGATACFSVSTALKHRSAEGVPETAGYAPRKLLRLVVATARHPPDADLKECVTTIQYVRCVLPPGASWDLRSYQQRNRGFPATSYKFEMYDEFDFEAYRQLGWTVMTDAVTKNWTVPNPGPKQPD